MLWYEFAGVDSRSLGVYLSKPLEIPAAERQMRFEEVPGRAGALRIDIGGYIDVDATIEGFLRDGDKMSAVRAWMQGAGDLVLSTAPERFYRIQVVGEVETPRAGRGLLSRTMTIPIRVSPFRYHREATPGKNDAIITVSPHTIPNPGTAESAPKIKIEGTGDVVLTIGTQIVEIDGLEDGIIIDSELGDCFNLTESALLNGKVTLMDDDFPTLTPGANIISWTGNVTKITITPRWRDV